MSIQITHGLKMKIHGRLDPFWETGSEGIHWAFDDLSLPGYDSLIILDNGDHLVVLNDDGSELWKGVINLGYKVGRQPTGWHDDDGQPYMQQAVMGHWVHGLQRNMAPTKWATMFFDKKRAILTKKKPRSTHVFHGKPEDMFYRLHSLTEDKSVELFRNSLYPWLIFYSNDDWGSLVKKWDFTFEETIRLIGSPTLEQIEKHKIYPKKLDDMLMPFNWIDFTRLALLFGIYAKIDWLIPNPIDWLNTIHSELNSTPKSLLLESNLDGIFKLHNLLSFG